MNFEEEKQDEGEEKSAVEDGNSDRKPLNVMNSQHTMSSEPSHEDNDDSDGDSDDQSDLFQQLEDAGQTNHDTTFDFGEHGLNNSNPNSRCNSQYVPGNLSSQDVPFSMIEHFMEEIKLDEDRDSPIVNPSVSAEIRGTEATASGEAVSRSTNTNRSLLVESAPSSTMDLNLSHSDSHQQLLVRSLQLTEDNLASLSNEIGVTYYGPTKTNSSTTLSNPDLSTNRRPFQLQQYHQQDAGLSPDLLSPLTLSTASPMFPMPPRHPMSPESGGLYVSNAYRYPHNDDSSESDGMSQSIALSIQSSVFDSSVVPSPSAGQGHAHGGFFRNNSFPNQQVHVQQPTQQYPQGYMQGQLFASRSPSPALLRVHSDLMATSSQYAGAGGIVDSQQWMMQQQQYPGLNADMTYCNGQSPQQRAPQLTRVPSGISVTSTVVMEQAIQVSLEEDRIRREQELLYQQAVDRAVQQSLLLEQQRARLEHQRRIELLQAMAQQYDAASNDNGGGNAGGSAISVLTTDTGNRSSSIGYSDDNHSYSSGTGSGSGSFAPAGIAERYAGYMPSPQPQPPSNYQQQQQFQYQQQLQQHQMQQQHRQPQQYYPPHTQPMYTGTNAAPVHPAQYRNTGYHNYGMH